MHAKDPSHGEFLQGGILMHWKYFDESSPYNQGQVGWYVSRVADPAEADRVVRAIDALSANSDHETRTQTSRPRWRRGSSRWRTFGLIVFSIMGAVFFTLLFLTGNAVRAQAVRERTTELAVLKTIGFSSTTVLMIVLAESVLLVLLGGVIGLGLAAVLGPIVSAGSGGVINMPPVHAGSWLLGLMAALYTCTHPRCTCRSFAACITYGASTSHLPPPEGTKKPRIAEYVPITAGKLSWPAICTNRCDKRCASVAPSAPGTWVSSAAMPPYSGNWISTPDVLGTARCTASRKLRGRQCSRMPRVRNRKL
ncbi:hypothetical protein RLIN73S_05871 [Rhodanobacter lindaniclasticus]